MNSDFIASRRGFVTTFMANVCCIFLLGFTVFILPILVYKNLILKEGSLTFDGYVNPPIVTKLNIYFFNITNIDQYEPNKFSEFEPKFKQIGPYALNLHRSRKIISHKDDALTTQFKDIIYYDAARSFLSFNETISTIDIKSITRFLSNRNKTAIFSKIGAYSHLFRDKFGLLKDINDTFQKEITVNTGEKDISSIYSLKEYEQSGQQYLDGCNNVVGTYEGVGFPPRTYNVKIFFPPFGRSFKLKYSSYSFGSTKFVFDPKSFMIKSFVQNQCYQYNEDSLVFDGMMEMLPVSADMDANPVYLSFPHFLYGSKDLINKVKGMEPNKKKHSSYYRVDTATGMPIKVRMRFQVNFLLDGKIIPLIWQEVLVDLDGAMKFQLGFVHFLIYYMPIIYLLCIVILSLCLCKSYKAHSDKYKVESVAFFNKNKK